MLTKLLIFFLFSCTDTVIKLEKNSQSHLVQPPGGSMPNQIQFFRDLTSQVLSISKGRNFCGTLLQCLTVLKITISFFPFYLIGIFHVATCVCSLSSYHCTAQRKVKLLLVFFMTVFMKHNIHYTLIYTSSFHETQYTASIKLLFSDRSKKKKKRFCIIQTLQRQSEVVCFFNFYFLSQLEPETGSNYTERRNPLI